MRGVNRALLGALLALVLAWVGGYLHGYGVGERDCLDRDP